MLSASRAIKRAAEEYRFLAVAFCQTSVDDYGRKDIDPGCVAQCKKLADPADVFIGISHVIAAADNLEGIYDQVQHMNVCAKGEASQLIPVYANFDFQRFEDIPRPLLEEMEGGLDFIQGTAASSPPTMPKSRCAARASAPAASGSATAAFANTPAANCRRKKATSTTSSRAPVAAKPRGTTASSPTVK
jgi:hypothetical protein